MRRFGICALILVLGGPTLAAPKKKKDTKSKTTPKKGSDDAEIEMEPDTPAPAPTPAPTPATPPVAETPPAPPAAALPPLNERPLTLPKARFEAHGGLPIAVLSLPDGMGGSSSSTSEGFAFGASYGIDDKLEIGGDYAISLNPGSVKGPLALHGAYTVLHDAKLDLAVAGALVIEPIDTTDPVSMKTNTTTFVAIEAGAWLRYHITPALSAFTGLPALPNGNVGLTRLSFALPPQPYQLTIGVNNDGAIAFDVAGGVAYQATPKIYAYGALTLAHIKIANTPNAFLFADFIPITIGGFYSLDKLDVGALFGTDGNRVNGAGLYEFEIAARYYVR